MEMDIDYDAPDPEEEDDSDWTGTYTVHNLKTTVLRILSLVESGELDPINGSENLLSRI